MVNVTRFWENNPNPTIQIKLMDSYSTLLLITQTTQGWMSFLAGVKGLNGGASSCGGTGFKRINGIWMHGLIQLAKCFLYGFSCTVLEISWQKC